MQDEEETVGLFKVFVKEIFETFGVDLEEANVKPDVKISTVRAFLNKLNSFFFEKFKEGDEEFFSKFHKFWREKHQEILEPVIDERKCMALAKVLDKVQRKYGRYRVANAFVEEMKTNKPVDWKTIVANARFFTATQEFSLPPRGFKKDTYKLAKEQPRLFDATYILDHFPNSIDELLNELGLRARREKRQDFIRNCAELLIKEYGGQAYNLLEKHDMDVVKIREALTSNIGLGYKKKKADMFLRDMLDLGVWVYESGQETLDVPSDLNTMKVALRTGILKPKIPLLSSFLDIYCHQYGLIDEKTREAWRKVWQKWGKIEGNSRVEAPVLFDFLIYNLGKSCCKKVKRTLYVCSNCGFQFEASARKKMCDKCLSKSLQKLRDYYVLPCERNEGCFRHTCKLRREYLTDCAGNCIFMEACNVPVRAETALNPPKSISILGRTGWESAEADEGGGLGLSS